MAVRNKLSKKQQSSFSFFTLLVDIIVGLIALGDGIRKAIGFVFHLPRMIWRGVITGITEVAQAIPNWLKEKKQSKPKRIARPDRKRTVASSTPFTQTLATYIKTKTAPVAAWIHALRIPSVSLPTFPKFTLPKFTWKFSRRQQHSTENAQVSEPISPIPVLPKTTSLFHIQSFIVGVALTILFILLPYNMFLFLRSLPNPQVLTQRDLEVTSKIFDRNGQLLYEIYADQNRTPIALSKIPTIVRDATISIEDHDFYRHMGFSPRGILRSAREIAVNKRVQGGSTITQQLIKSALLTPEVNIIRKAKELILAFWAERIYSKDQILEMYFNQVPYGGTAWGIESAAQTYFNKSVTDLNLSEAALLAGLPAAPTEYSPFGNHPEKAFIRQKEVLRRMTQDGIITQTQMDEALATPIHFAQPRVSIRAPHFVMYVKQLLEERFGPRLVERGGLRITTSLDASIQEKVEDIVKTQVAGLASLQVGNGAALVTNPKTGEILAMAGSRDYFDTTHDGNVNITTTMQQPGSAIKVITYAAALEKGMTAATLLSDAPIVYNQEGSEPYAPVNYDGKFHGLVPLRSALANSYNIPAVKLLSQLGVSTLLQKGNLMGINSWEQDPTRYGLSLTLGGGEVTMLEMAKVYGTLANMGKRQDLLPILEVSDYTGRVIERYNPKNAVEALKADVAWLITNILSDNNARTPAFGPNSSLVIPGKTVAVKTGTTNEKRDNWTAGYTPSYVVVVWVGNNDNTPMNPYLTSGITGAAPIWHDIMTELLKGRADELWPVPPTIVSLPCYFGRVEYFVQGTEPTNGRCGAIPTISPTPTP
jgi:1A family penicillin-binding protein